MKILVIGYGSIGKRHAGNLVALGHDVILLRHSSANKNQDGFKEYYDLAGAVKSEGGFDGAVIASPTSKHLADATALIERDIPFLMEKPPTADLAGLTNLKKQLLDTKFTRYDIAYNLRYYPLLKFLKEFLPQAGQVYSARIQAGSYLPGWRKNVDYRKTSSASKELGGGVHLELVHEIDYVLWFFGRPTKVFSSIDKISDLEISTDDLCATIFKYETGPVVELHLDYLSHKPLRGCQIIAQNGTIEADLNAGRISYFDKKSGVSEEIYKLPDGPKFSDTYIDEMRNFIGIIQGEKKTLVDIDSAEQVMKAVAAMESSAKEGKWIAVN